MESITTYTDEWTSAAHDAHIFRYTVIATASCLIYDYILTLNDERSLIWSSHLSVMKVAFFVNRYMPLFATIGMIHTLLFLNAFRSDYFTTCKLRFLIFSGFILTEFLVSTFIIYMRAYAVWGCKRPMLAIFSTAYIVLGAVALYLFAHFISSTTVDPIRFPHQTGCVLGFHSCHVCVFSLIVLVISETFAMAMFIVKAVQMPGSSTMQRITEDGVIYFLIVIGASIANIVVLNKSPPSLCDFLLASQSALQSICCNHLFFRIRSPDAGTIGSPASRSATRTHSKSRVLGRTTTDDIEMSDGDIWVNRGSDASYSKAENA